MEYRVFPMDSATWRIEEYDDRNSVYMYLLLGQERALLLDTGFGCIAVRDVVSELTSLPVEVLCTHGHFDHIGGNSQFDTVWMHQADQPLYQLHTSPEMRASIPGGPFLPVRDNIRWFDGEPVFALGGRNLRVIHTPGHSLGSVCVLDIQRRWLFTGDTCCKADVLLNLEYSTCVAQYSRSMKKLLAIQDAYDITWPGHHAVPVEPEVLEQFAGAADLLCSGTVEGDDFAFPFGAAKRFAYQDIAIVYTPENIHE